MPNAWPQAALEAQAIVARTYVLRKRNPAKPYDVVAGTADQMYGGINAEAPSATTAVTATSGLIVTYAGLVADVAYMSCCGGHTEDSQRIWGSDLPYLHGVADPYCAAAPDSSWTIALDWNNVARALKCDNDVAFERVQVIGMPGARPTAIRFIGDGTSQDVDILDLRRISEYRIPSTYIRNVTLQRSDDDAMTVVISGSGRGHGVGLCQWGARGMATAGASAAQILAYYFPTTGLGQASSIT
jgi:stage II sporulation protein D